MSETGEMQTKETMPCGYADMEVDNNGKKTIYTLEELKQKGWEVETSFHSNFPDDWNLIAKKVEHGQIAGLYEYGLVRGQSRLELEDSVTYLVKRVIGEK